MTRVGRRTGLIRLTSHEAVADGRLQWLTPRVVAYAAIWILLVTTVTVLVARRPALDVLVLRQPGTLFATLPDGRIGNFYNVQVFNRTGVEVPFEIVAAEPRTAGLTPLGLPGHVGPHALNEGRLLVAVPTSDVTPGVPLRFVVVVKGAVVQRIATSFVGPLP